MWFDDFLHTYCMYKYSTGQNGCRWQHKSAPNNRPGSQSQSWSFTINHTHTIIMIYVYMQVVVEWVGDLNIRRPFVTARRRQSPSSNNAYTADINCSYISSVHPVGSECAYHMRLFPARMVRPLSHRPHDANHVQTNEIRFTNTYLTFTVGVAVATGSTVAGVGPARARQTPFVSRWVLCYDVYANLQKGRQAYS